MLSKHDNELLVHVGPGTAMGDLLREYWVPTLLSSELPTPDGDPVRVRVLGEDLVGFRDSMGRPGLLGAHCPHRGAPLFFGRNEECGLRCVYHGWKFDVAGQCVDMPNEPSESNFRDRIHPIAYPSVELGGVVWAYLGRSRPVPSLPALEWIGLPPSQRYEARRVQFCNWVQALEGDIDQSHVSFAHRNLKTPDSASERSKIDRIRTMDTHPRFAVLDTDYGVLIGAARQAEADQEYWRITQFLLPWWSMTGPYGENPIRHSRAWIPMDDETTLVFSVTFHPLRDLKDQETVRMRDGSGAGYVGEANFLPPTSEPGGAWVPKSNRGNDYRVDRAQQRTTSFTGIPEFWAQDAAMQEGMGVIFDRSSEHLGTSDLGIIRVRQRLLKEAQERARCLVPPISAREACLYKVRGAATLLPAGTSWVEATEDIRTVRPGFNPPGV